MKKAFLSISIAGMLQFFLLLPVVKAGGDNFKRSTYGAHAITTKGNDELSDAAIEERSTALYEYLNLDALGMAKQALMLAVKGHQKLVRKGIIPDNGIVTVCDFSQPSNKKRLYILDIDNMKVLFNTFVAHGKNSGVTYAQRFSNRPESLQSSLGFYVTKQTYIGQHGLSLKLAGLDKGFNDRAESRAVVVHGADYIGEQRLGTPYMGRSFGCPAVPANQAARVIDLIKNGTCLFIYHPSVKYLHGSKILNG